MRRAMPEALVNPLADNATIKSIPLEHFPRDLFMIGRSLMILRGLTHALGMDVKVAGCLLLDTARSSIINWEISVCRDFSLMRSSRRSMGCLLEPILLVLHHTDYSLFVHAHSMQGALHPEHISSVQNA